MNTSEIPTISVIVPVYRAEQYIESCVQSILNQTHQDFELILVEDGSPDRSGEICDTLALRDSRISVIHKENGGAATARNAGLDAAKGEYIAFIDGDDVVHPQYLEFLLGILKRSGADISMCLYDFFSEEGAWFDEPVDASAADFTVDECPDMLARFTSHYRRVSLISLCLKLFKREIFEDLHIPEGQTAEDSLVLPMILERAKSIAKAQLRLYHWRETPGSVTRGGLNTNYFHRVNISYAYAAFFAERGDKVQADYFKREYLQRTLAHYYKTSREKPELLEAFRPYVDNYRRRFWECWRAKGMCLRERAAYALFLIAPAMAKKLYRQVHGEGRP